MNFKCLYNPDNGICAPYSEFVAQNRSDLIPITEEEMKMLATMRIEEIVARRRVGMPEVAIEIAEPRKEEVKEVKEEGGNAPAAPKGISVEGKIEKPVEQGESKFDVFGDEIVDYSVYFGNSAPIFPVEQLASVKDEDLVRFAKEAMRRNYENPPITATQEERDEYFKFLRERIAKGLARVNRKRIERANEKGAN